MSFLEGEKLQSEIRRFLKENASKCCAVAFIGKGTSSIINGDVRIVCNLFNNGTNPYEIESMIKRKNVQIRHLDNLHTKIYTTNEYAIWGSANMTDHALNYFGTGDNLIECADKVKKDTRPLSFAKIKKFAECLWERGKDITPSMICKAKQMRNHIDGNLFKKINIRNLCDEMNLFCLTYSDCELSDSAQKIAQEKLGSDWERKGFCVWENWGDLPNGYFIDLFVNEKKEIMYNGISKYDGFKIKNISISQKIRSPKGLKNFICNTIIPRIKDNLEFMPNKKNSYGKIISINRLLQDT